MKEPVMVLKTRNLVHTLEPNTKGTKDDRAPKTRLKFLKKCIETVNQVKSDSPKPKDVVKAAEIFFGETPTYIQAWNVLHKKKKKNALCNEESFQLIGPYLDTFKEKNPNSIVDYHHETKTKDTYSNTTSETTSLIPIDRCFVCPGIMNAKLRLVRPVISVDAAHLKSKYKGTLYVATVLSGNNEILPIAFAICTNNECTDGWNYFLTNLKNSCSYLTVPHPRNRCQPWKYFVFISDRDKGVIEAARQVFPDNLHTHCVVHISRNVGKRHGNAAAIAAQNIGKTFSVRQENFWINELNALTTAGYNYVKNINPISWRNTSWVLNHNLPPRYGITSTNISESTNNMVEAARNMSWLGTIDSILETITVRIATLKEKYKNHSGFICSAENNVQKMFEKCASCVVIPINEETGIYKIKRAGQVLEDESVGHELDIVQRTCTCGKWQDEDMPCIDYMAYLRKIKKWGWQEILEKEVSDLYHTRTLKLLYDTNINPVVMSILQNDGITGPPDNTDKQQAGRPKKKRLRSRPPKKQRSKKNQFFVPECGKPGHNRKTCAERKLLEAQEAEFKAKHDKKDGDTAKYVAQNRNVM